MGDYILMKTFSILVLLFIIENLYANELQWVDQQVQAIKPPRVGITKSELNTIVDPFLYIVKEKKKVTKTPTTKKAQVVRHAHSVKKHYSRKLYLEAILNKSALINHKWYKENQRVYGYKLIKINRTSVVLQKQHKKLLLSTVIKHKNLIFHNK